MVATVLSSVAAGGSAAALAFEDAQDFAGIAFVHAASEVINTNYPETTGSGACWADVDGDGTDDLFLVNGKYGNATLQAAFDPRSALYLNDGDGTFTEVAREWGVDFSGWAQGCSLADYDADADLDLLLVGYDLVVLFRNDGGRFTDATAAANLTLADECPPDPHCFGESGSWADYDLDGDLDLYLSRMVDWDIDDPALVAPGLYNGQPNALFRNRGDGTFEDATAEAGVADDPGPNHSKSFMSAWADYDRDGDPDLYIASDTTPNTLFENLGDGTFVDVAVARNADDPGASMGLVFQDINGDALPDLFFTHYAGEHNGFYWGTPSGEFTRRSGMDGLSADFYSVGWGTGAFDFDHDGLLDLYAVNGHTTDIPDIIEGPQLPLLWLQNAQGNFTDVSNTSGPSFQTKSVARGSAAADYDLDGDLDIAVLAMWNETARLFQNQGVLPHWLQVEVRQPGFPDVYALGAEVTVRPAGSARFQLRILQAGSSFLSQDSLVVHAGLGEARSADVQIRWPDGTVETWTGIAADQRVRLSRGDPVVVRDTLAPRTKITFHGDEHQGWYRGPVEAALEPGDRAMGLVSGVARTVARADGGPWEETMRFVLQGDGLHIVEASSTDFAGNREPGRPHRVGIDTTPPETSAILSGPQGSDGWFSRLALVALEASDATSGVAQVWGRVDGGAWVQGSTLVVDQGGLHRVEFYAVDVAGNAGEVRSVEVKVDRDAPAVAFGAWPLHLAAHGTAVDVAATDGSSGVRRVAFYVGDEAAPRHVDDDGSDGWSWALDLPVGQHLLRARAEDAVGHAGEDRVVVLVLPVLPLPPLPALLVGAPLLARGRRRKA